MGVGGGLLVIGLLAAGCATGDGERGVDAPATTTAARQTRYAYGDPPDVDDGAAPSVAAIFAGIVADLSVAGSPTDRLDALVAGGDARHAWLISDLMRFSADSAELDRLVAAFTALTGVDPAADPTFAQSPWKSVADHLIAWDLPAPPDYREMKADLFTVVEPRWAPFFADAGAAIDWRWVSWGGVLIDDRRLGSTRRVIAAASRRSTIPSSPLRRAAIGTPMTPSCSCSGSSRATTSWPCRSTSWSSTRWST